MIEKLNFEEIATNFSRHINYKNPKLSSISRCDHLIIESDRLLFIEETNLNRKDLFNPVTFSEEIIENAKKMWGSFAIALATLDHAQIKGKDRYYILQIDKLSPRNGRAFSNLIKHLYRYRNSAITQIKYKERD